MGRICKWILTFLQNIFEVFIFLLINTPFSWRKLKLPWTINSRHYTDIKIKILNISFLLLLLLSRSLITLKCFDIMRLSRRAILLTCLSGIIGERKMFEMRNIQKNGRIYLKWEHLPFRKNILANINISLF